MGNNKGLTFNGSCLPVLLALVLLSVSTDVTAQKKKQADKSNTTQKRLIVNAMTDYEGAWVANVETDIYQLGTYENFTFGYSAKNDWDFSVSLLNVQIAGSNLSFQGEPFVNTAKTFVFTSQLEITLGSLNGFTSGTVGPTQWLAFNFIDFQYVPVAGIEIHGGPYLANKAITGTSRQAGFQTGIEIDLLGDRLALNMNYISGHQSLSGANVNLTFNMTPLFQVYLGVLVPEANSGNEFAGVVGFNYSSHPL